jgi:hypothetical protein
MSAILAESVSGTAPIPIPEREPPTQPYRGIAPFRFLDQPIFFGRIAESRRLLRLVTMFRGVLLYGDSGAGKSSLLNARFVPEALADGFLPERIRVQPKIGAEIVVDRIAVRERGLPPFLPSNLVSATEEPRVVMSCEQLQERLGRRDLQGYPLVILDQFEEFVTLFEIAPRTPEEYAEAAQAQERLLKLLATFLVASAVPVKLLFAFREDYFTKLQNLFTRCRDLTDQSMRVLPPSIDELPLTIRGPFEKNPGMFANPLSEAVCAQLEAELRERTSGGLQNPTEVQIAGLMLWLSVNPEELLTRRKVQGLLEDYLVQQLEALQASQRTLAVALLSRLVTDVGTRNIVSRSDLVERVAISETVTKEAVSGTLDALVEKTGLVREEFRDRTAFYQIISEFLVPWIRTQKTERARIEAEQALAHERIEADERLARERKEAEQKLALQHAEAERCHAEVEQRFLGEKLRSAHRARAVLIILALLLLVGWAIALLQSFRAQQQYRRAEREKEFATSAEDAARTALEKNALTAAAADDRLLKAASALERVKAKTKELQQRLSVLSLRSDFQENAELKQLRNELQKLSDESGLQGNEIQASAQLTRQEAAEITAPLGWSLYGKLDTNQTWIEHYFHRESSNDPKPEPGDVVVADVFVNVRELPSSYDSEHKKWVLERIKGIIAPKQRIKVAEIRQVEGVADDPPARLWIRIESPPH